MTSVCDGPRESELVNASRQYQERPFSPAACRAWWLSLFLLHLIGALFFGLVAFAYWMLPSLVVSTWLDFYQIGMASSHYNTIAIAHSIVACFHALSALMMVIRSIRNKKLTFRGNLRELQQDGLAEKRSRASGRMRRLACYCYATLFARNGLFGIEGRYYDLLLLCREVVETALQSSQGYRMSRNVPRPWLNRFYVSLLVANCWSTVMVHHVFRHSKTKMHLVALLADCLLDLASSVGIPLLLVVKYADQFDLSTGNFLFLKWFQDIWLMNTMSEFKIILVLSWWDLATRMIFAMSMLSNMNTMEALMTLATSKGSQSTPTSLRGSTIAPLEQSKPRLNTKPHHRSTSPAIQTFTSKGLRASFFCWGIVILALQIHAESNPKLPQCLVQVQPWGVAKPACSLVLLNCLTDGLDGESDLITERWSQFDANSVATLLARNCPKLEMPPIFKSFHLMRTFKVYNSTITKWDDDAAFDKANHPNMLNTMYIRVNTTDGEIPMGLQSANFPQTLNIIGFVVSNLRTLPADLHTKWPPYSALNLFATQLTTFPDTLWRLRPSLLVMANTPVEAVPKELFELDRMWYLDLAGTKVSALPEDVKLFTNPLIGLNLGDTNISSFPSWIDPWLERMASPLAPPLVAANSPYCLERQRILSGEQTAFSAATSRQDGVALSKLLDASDSNRAFLTSAVSCEPSFLFRYALAFEDTFQTL
ncbi:hypothetical protein BBJ28_00002520 [Nothophytophthora sp. Chile5]|nr:hypothetical protein BBJ28_00002520 [Nothophytophthora sp. Chile5]